jgi:hypothetical protein
MKEEGRRQLSLPPSIPSSKILVSNSLQGPSSHISEAENNATYSYSHNLSIIIYLNSEMFSDWLLAVRSRVQLLTEAATLLFPIQWNTVNRGSLLGAKWLEHEGDHITSMKCQGLKTHLFFITWCVDTSSIYLNLY